MSADGWSRILVLGGIRSGKSEFAESLVRESPRVRYVATATANPDDPEWAARIETHRLRRPSGWATEEAGTDPGRLVELIKAAGPDETLLVDDLGGWVSVLLDPAHQPADDVATVAELGAAVRDCAACLVLVSPEVGLSLVPTTPLGRAFADALGTTNQAVADACDTVVLVVAGQPTRLKETGSAFAPAAQRASVPTQAGADRGAGTAGRPGGDQPGGDQPAGQGTPTTAWAGVLGAVPEVLRPTAAAPEASTAPAPVTGTAWTTPTTALPTVDTGLVIQPGMELPMPDDQADAAAVDRLATLDLPGSGLGNLTRVIEFAAATQRTATPTPWRSVRVLLLHGDHAGGASAGTAPGESARRAAQARTGAGPLARLAAEAGASLQVVEVPAAAAMEHGPALSPDDVEAALRYGWRLAEEAVDSGVDLLVLAACGAGTDAAAVAVLAATANAEPAAVLGRVVGPDGQVDDPAWMSRCAAVRDALQRTRRSPRDAKDVLAELGGGDIAVATGILLGATARRTPVLLDGPVGVAAGLVSRDLAGQARHWCLLPDHGDRPAVRFAAEVLDKQPLLDLRLGLGEGTAALAALPLLRAALTLAGCVSTPTPAEPDREPVEADDSEFAEPRPAGPGPTAVPDPAPAPAHEPAPGRPTAPDDGAGSGPADSTAATSTRGA